jgi:hypothetical protein
MKIQKFIKRGEDNPDGLPESSNITQIEFYPELFEENKLGSYPLIVEFNNGSRYEYKVQRIKHLGFDQMWTALTEGWQRDEKTFYTPGKVFHNFIKFKCPYRKLT